MIIDIWNIEPFKKYFSPKNKKIDEALPLDFTDFDTILGGDKFLQMAIMDTVHKGTKSIQNGFWSL